MSKKLIKSLIVVVLLAAIAAFFALGGDQYLSLEAIKEQKENLNAYYQANPLQMLVLFGLAYVFVTALSLPGAAIMTLGAGAIFGFVPALIMASFASTIGATLAFLASRFLLRDWIQAKFGDKLGAINEGVEKEGSFYLFAMRLTPIFPFWLVNLLMGVTKIRMLTYYIVSQIGMLPGTAVFVLAGTKLGEISSLGDILSPSLIASFVALGVFPLVAKKALSILRKKR